MGSLPILCASCCCERRAVNSNLQGNSSDSNAYKPEYIKQEIWAKLIAYNITETRINHTIIEKGNTKYEYKVNFSMAAHICRVFLRPDTEKDSMDVMSLLL